MGADWRRVWFAVEVVSVYVSVWWWWCGGEVGLIGVSNISWRASGDVSFPFKSESISTIMLRLKLTGSSCNIGYTVLCVAPVVVSEWLPSVQYQFKQAISVSVF